MKEVDPKVDEAIQTLNMMAMKKRGVVGFTTGAMSMANPRAANTNAIAKEYFAAIPTTNPWLRYCPDAAFARASPFPPPT